MTTIRRGRWVTVAVGLVWLFLVGLLVGLLHQPSARAQPYVVPRGPVTLPLPYPAGPYTSEGFTLTPKPPDPPIPPLTPSGGVYLRVQSVSTGGQGSCAWHGDRPYTVACSTAGKALTLAVAVRAQMGTATLAGVSGRYMLNDQPLSPVLTGTEGCTTCVPWTWTDAASLTGVHAVWFQVTDEQWAASYRPFASLVFGSVETGAQWLPVLPQWAVTRVPGGTSLYYDSGIAGWIRWTPTLEVARPQPWQRPGVLAELVPDTARRFDPAVMVVTPSSSGSRHHYGAGMPQVRVTPSKDFPLMAQLPPGQPYVTVWHPQAGNRSEFARTGVADREPHAAGPRGLATETPYVSVVGLPSRETGPRWRALDLSGRLYDLEPDGRITDIIPAEGSPLAGANDLAIFPIIGFTDRACLTWVANTYQHTIDLVDACASPPTITTVVGKRGTTGTALGPGLTTRLNRPYSLKVHGPHTCPGRPEFTDCYHFYWTDLRNGRILTSGLHRPHVGELPPSVTQVVGGLYEPMWFDWFNNWDILLAEAGTTCLKRYAHATGTLATIVCRPFGLNTAGEQWFGAWVDRTETTAGQGTIGPLDTIYFRIQVSHGAVMKINADGTGLAQVRGDRHLLHGPGRDTNDAWGGHYGWTATPHSTLPWEAPVWAAMYASGFGTLGNGILSPRMPADDFAAINTTCYNRGASLVNSLRTLRMMYGPLLQNRVGQPTADDLALLPEADLLELMRVWKPGITDDDAKAMAYYVKLLSARRFFAGPITC
jgi:hypothetical protein